MGLWERAGETAKVSTSRIPSNRKQGIAFNLRTEWEHGIIDWLGCGVDEF
jgi:hypothetical protein